MAIEQKGVAEVKKRIEFARFRTRNTRAAGWFDGPQSGARETPDEGLRQGRRFSRSWTSLSVSPSFTQERDHPPVIGLAGE